MHELIVPSASSLDFLSACESTYGPCNRRCILHHFDAISIIALFTGFSQVACAALVSGITNATTRNSISPNATLATAGING